MSEPMTIFRSGSATPESEERIAPVGIAAGEIRILPISEIAPNPGQPRKSFDEEAIASLADSIGQYGILQPLSVRMLPGGRYELISGERRLRAARRAGLLSVPCVIADVDSLVSAELAIIENLQREDLNMFEEAYAIASLIDRYAMTQEEIAYRLSVSQSAVANKLRLLRHTEGAKKLILENRLTERHARALLRIRDDGMRDEALLRVIARNLNVAATEAFVETLLNETAPTIRRRRHYNGAMKDIRLFYNSIDNALDIARRSGVGVTAEKKEEDGIIELTIRIVKNPGETAN